MSVVCLLAAGTAASPSPLVLAPEARNAQRLVKTIRVSLSPNHRLALTTQRAAAAADSSEFGEANDDRHRRGNGNPGEDGRENGEPGSESGAKRAGSRPAHDQTSIAQ